jgi:hypothetical protein
MRRHRRISRTEGERSPSMEKLLAFFRDYEPHRLTREEAEEFGSVRPQDKKDIADKDARMLSGEQIVKRRRYIAGRLEKGLSALM